LTGGDSGGAVFLKDGSDWKLAGINFAVDGSFSLYDTGSNSFNAALFDAGGLYIGRDGSQWNLITNTVEDVPTSFYATRISSNLPWIYTAVPEPEEYTLAAVFLMLGLAVWCRNCLRGTRRPEKC
jgi:hypothetical protein